jgi:Na+-translocating ferredoxin:NAD+ oxidoreductase subunit G
MSDENIKLDASNNNTKEKVSRLEIGELFKNTFIMIVIAVLAGGILGYVYELTKEPIALMQAKEIKEANQKVFMLADSFSDSVFSEHPVSSTVREDYPEIDINDCIEAYDVSGELLGYVIEVTTHEGYGGDITFRMGVDITGTLNAVSITDISETAGLGMRAEEVLVPQFSNRNETYFEVTKTGASFDNQIDAITSATITSTAITDGVNAGLEYYRECLMGGEASES